MQHREKQIEEMAMVIATKAFEQAHLENGDDNLADIVATDLYDKGYCKASEVAREIFEEIDRMIYRLLNDRHYIVGDMCYEVEELKKKYTQDKGRDKIAEFGKYSPLSWRNTEEGE